MYFSACLAALRVHGAVHILGSEAMRHTRACGVWARRAAGATPVMLELRFELESAKYVERHVLTNCSNSVVIVLSLSSVCGND